MAKFDSAARLSALRALMKEEQVDVYVIPSEDSHSSEYIAPCDTRRAYLSGFNGSAGWAIVAMDKAALSTDGRYFNQATKQLDENWILLRQGITGVPSWQDWTAEQSSGGRTVAVDPALISGPTAVGLAEKIKRWGGAQLKPLDTNLVDIVWGAARPARSSLPVALHGRHLSGDDVDNKLALVRKVLAKKNSPAMVVSALDDIAWLFNLRGADIPYNPVFFAYAIVTLDSATLFIDDIKLTTECRDYLASSNVRVRPYDSIFQDTRALRASLGPEIDAEDSGTPRKRFLLSNTASWALKLALGGNGAVEDVRSPIGDLKAVKNAVELSGMRECHVRDGAALIEYFAWLEDQLVAKKAILDEVEAADKLEALRKKQPYFVGLSFPTISSTGANAAVIHYQAQRGACSVIDPDAIYLCDAGAQYLDGTTDTTRTLHFGKPLAEEKRAYTLVLKGHIALDMAVFPSGTTGLALDCLARQYLRRDGLDYRHSTGHGVGSYLNVHEGPIGIGTRPELGEVALRAGNVVSIEPGYYEDGFFGVRIENVVMVRHVKTPNCFGGEPYLGFEHATMVPFCRNLIEEALLSDEDKRWINSYHARVYECMGSRFEDDGLTLAWLTRETRPY